MSDLLYDLRMAWKSLLRAPGYLAVCLLTLAIGLGANTAVFSLVDAVLLRGLPYRAPERLVHLWSTGGDRVVRRHELSLPDFQDLQRQQASFSGLGSYSGAPPIALALPGGLPEAVALGRMDAGFLPTLGVQPERGLGFTAADELPGAAPSVLVSHRFWQARLGADPAWVGRSLQIGGLPRQVVGVLPAGFQFAPVGSPDLWIPLALSPRDREARGAYRLACVARLKEGVPLAQAQAELRTIAGRLAAAHPESRTGSQLEAMPLREQLVGPVRPVLLALLASVAMVLLVACANLAALTLARLSSRRKEIAVRLALGAGRAQLVRFLLVEGVSLSVLGGGLGLLLGRLGLTALVAGIPANQRAMITALDQAGLDARVFLFTLGLSAAAGLFFALGPALRASREAPLQAMQEEGRGGTDARGNRTRGLLVVGELALTTVLLLGAGLLIRSFTSMLATDPGFNPKDLLTLQVRLDGPDGAQRFQSVLGPELERRLGALPGVRGVAMVDVPPLTGGGNTGSCRIEGRAPLAPGQELGGNVRTIDAAYFQVMQIPLLRGRAFTAEDHAGAPLAMVVNKAFADQAFPGQEPLGQGIVFDWIPGRPVYRVVGVVGNERQTALDGPVTPVLYFHTLQDAESTFVLLVRAAHPEALLPLAAAAVHQADPSALILGSTTFEQLISNSRSVFLRRYPAALLAVLSAVALLLAAVGIYGVMAYSVARRTREFGIRLALGADGRGLLRLVMGQGLRLVALGAGIGLAAALGFGALLRHALFGVPPWDPVALAGVLLLLALAAAAACLVPALRAALVDPAEALRSE